MLRAMMFYIDESRSGGTIRKRPSSFPEWSVGAGMEAVIDGSWDHRR